jgi:hypothetical protein
MASTLIDVLRTYIRNTQITPLDSRAAQKQSRDCSNNQQTNQTAIYAHFQNRGTSPENFLSGPGAKIPPAIDLAKMEEPRSVGANIDGV